MLSSTPSKELRRLALSLVQPGFVGTEAPDWVLRRIGEGLSSVVLFARNIATPEQVARLTASLRAENPALIIAIDEEAGDVTRIESWTGSTRPGNYALGTVDDVELTESVARDLGRELHAAGITLNYAPSADVNSNPRNPVIGVRSFGASTDLVSRHSAAWIRGLQSAGVAACAKHFPGHGDTAVDSHLGLPSYHAGIEQIEAESLPPFRAALAAGVRAVMSGHLLVPAYDQDNPATMSRRILVDLLRTELGFDGLVVTDGIEMGAVTNLYGIDGATVRAVVGGADAICVGGESATEGTVNLLTGALLDALGTGELSEERLRDAARRVQEFADWSMGRSRSTPTDRISGDIGFVAARRAIRMTDAAQGALPLKAAPHVVELVPTMNLAIGKETPWGVATPLRERLPGTTFVRVHEDDLAAAGGAEAPVLEELALGPSTGRPLVVVVRDAARHGWMAAALAQLLRARPDAVVVEMGLPGTPGSEVVQIATHGATTASGVAAAELLAGAPDRA
ncbi:glycoside hydrolase family 3 protein [Streptacidiphilus sp. PB12-B1b]|uniref:glycoside hydrolase family 3 protein n=1 Tax=Streptacidiphilus sp. PB12-B1b TaxID=2705012 RepID=UPI0015FCB06A|nr:glycoside hydrolase family 3 protein [Streptacidiphilus sp. PB12-B1b]QMU74560.1 glycoside hydrolase family 3 protein [Streptacidiphilus sp. PB12-B1b]